MNLFGLSFILYKSLAQLSTSMHVLKEKIIFIITQKQEYTEINTKFSTPHFISTQILSYIKAISGSSYTCFRVFGHHVNLWKFKANTPSYAEEHT